MKSVYPLCTEVPQYNHCPFQLELDKGLSPTHLVNIGESTKSSPETTDRYQVSSKNSSNDAYESACMRMATSVTDRRWSPGDNLNIHFLDGTPEIHRKVLTDIQEWMKYANLKITSDPSQKSDIRVSFRGDAELGGGNWSRVGTDARNAAPDAPTMNLVINEYMSDAEIRQVVLHEFGHAIGFVHEHSSPASDIKWADEKVYAYYARTFGWSKELVRANVFEKYDGTQTQFSKFDPDSIMLYHIAAGLTQDGWLSKLNTELSATDKEYAAKWYPYPVEDDTMASSTLTATEVEARGLHNGTVFDQAAICRMLMEGRLDI